MYHDVIEAGAPDDSGFPGSDAALYKLDRLSFVAHVEACARALTAPPGSVFDLPAASSCGRLPVLLTFDDGGASAETTVADELDRRRWRGHFFVATDFIDVPGFLSRRQIRDLHRRGHIIGTHSCSHPLRMAHCAWPQLLEEWHRSADVLGEILGEPVRAASVPGGLYSRSVAIAASRAGISHLFTSEPVVKSRLVGTCVVLGRFAVQRRMRPAVAAALVLGRSFPRYRQYLLWNAKKFAKTLAGNQYLRIRRALLRRR